MGFIEVITLILILLKLFGVITWSWGVIFIGMYFMVVFYLVLAALWFIGFMKIKKEFKKMKF